MIGISARGNFKRQRDFLNRIRSRELFKDLENWGEMGANALREATPVDTGLSAGSWAYRVIRTGRWPGLEWYNTNTVNGTPVVILIQYGHGTGTGGYIQGRDFINPAMRPVFDHIRREMWKKVK